MPLSILCNLTMWNPGIAMRIEVFSNGEDGLQTCLTLTLHAALTWFSNTKISVGSAKSQPTLGVVKRMAGSCALGDGNGPYIRLLEMIGKAKPLTKTNGVVL